MLLHQQRTTTSITSERAEYIRRSWWPRASSFAWLFTYMPVGLGARAGAAGHGRAAGRACTDKVRENWRHTVPHLLCGLLERRRVRRAARIAGGSSATCHTNAAGDVEPCAFIHYSDSNIREKTLLECVQVPALHEPTRRRAALQLQPRCARARCWITPASSGRAWCTSPARRATDVRGTPRTWTSWRARPRQPLRHGPEKSAPIWAASPKGRLSIRLAKETGDPNAWVKY